MADGINQSTLSEFIPAPEYSTGLGKPAPEIGMKIGLHRIFKPVQCQQGILGADFVRRRALLDLIDIGRQRLCQPGLPGFRHGVIAVQQHVEIKQCVAFASQVRAVDQDSQQAGAIAILYLRQQPVSLFIREVAGPGQLLRDEVTYAVTGPHRRPVYFRKGEKPGHLAP